MMNQLNFSTLDIQHMQRALQLAEHAAHNNEVPVGAVVIDNQTQQIIGEGYNQPISSNDPTAHAEIIALRHAGQNIKNYRLLDTTLYVTLEPCAMCAYAMLHARIKRLVFGTSDPRTGAIHSAIDLFNASVWNHKIICENGLLSHECGNILREFFQARR